MKGKNVIITDFDPLPPKGGINSEVINRTLSTVFKSPLGDLGVRRIMYLFIFLKYHFFNCLIIIALTLQSCTERMEIETEEGFIRLVVDGSISTEKTKHTVRLTTTEGYFSGQPFTPVTSATVTITDGYAVYPLRETGSGKYQTMSGVFGIPGRRYRLNIKLSKSVGGYTEYSAETDLLPPAKLDSVSVKFYPDWDEQGMWEVKGYFQDSPDPDYYRFLLYRNGNSMTNSLSDWYITDDFFFNGKYLRGTTLGWLSQHQEHEALQKGDTLTAEVQVLHADFARFLLGMKSNLYGSNPLFSGPPANVKGNITNGAIGYFSAYSISRAQMVITETDQTQ